MTEQLKQVEFLQILNISINKGFRVRIFIYKFQSLSNVVILQYRQARGNHSLFFSIRQSQSTDQSIQTNNQQG